MSTDTRRFLTSGEAAKRLDLSRDGVRYLEGRGFLRSERTEGGLRLFRLVDVERLAAERRVRRAARP